MSTISISRKQAGLLLTALLSTAVMGCGGDGPTLVPVEGTIIMGGAPLAEAEVTFQPPSGRPSSGMTDSQGHYKLLYLDEKDGALPGRHKVLITTYVEPDSDYEPPDRRAGRPEQVPMQYNHNSTLEAVVNEGQSEPIDFTLEPDGEIYSPDAEEET